MRTLLTVFAIFLCIRGFACVIPLDTLKGKSLIISPVDTIAVKKDSRFTTDVLGNIFIISPTNDIEKYDKNGIKLATANFKVLGNITSIDATNAFDIYVFYRDQNKILYLDNLLNIKGETNLEDIGISQCAAFARSFDDQLWLVDMGDLKIKKYSKDLKFIGESASLNTIITDEPILPEKLVDFKSTLYVLNNGTLLNFDAFINYTRTVFSDSIEDFQIIQKISGDPDDSVELFQVLYEQVMYIKDSTVYTYNTLNFQFSKLPLYNNGKIKNIRIEKERLYILSDESLILHSYREN
jgi:hypothetical protein